MITVPDIRWARRDIKSVSLLPNVQANSSGRGRRLRGLAWSTPDGVGDRRAPRPTPGSSPATTRGDPRCQPRDPQRHHPHHAARMIGEGYGSRNAPSPSRRRTAGKEAFITSSTNFVMPVTQIDGRPVGNGHPGILTGKLRRTDDYISARTWKHAQLIAAYGRPCGAPCCSTGTTRWSTCWRVIHHALTVTSTPWGESPGPTSRPCSGSTQVGPRRGGCTSCGERTLEATEIATAPRGRPPGPSCARAPGGRHHWGIGGDGGLYLGGQQQDR